MNAPTKTRRPRKPKGAAPKPQRPAVISQAARDEAAALKTAPRRTLPASWWDETVAVNMAAWITNKYGPNGAPVRIRKAA